MIPADNVGELVNLLKNEAKFSEELKSMPILVFVESAEGSIKKTFAGSGGVRSCDGWPSYSYCAG